jgi:hypothetical protein
VKYMSKEVVVVKFDVLRRHLPRGTGVMDCDNVTQPLL